MFTYHIISYIYIYYLSPALARCPLVLGAPIDRTRPPSTRLLRWKLRRAAGVTPGPSPVVADTGAGLSTLKSSGVA